MSATTSDKVGWVVGLVLAIAIVIWILWPSKYRGPAASTPAAPVAGAGRGSAGSTESNVKPDGVAVAGSPVDEKGASRQAVGAAGIPEATNPAIARKLHILQPEII